MDVFVPLRAHGAVIEACGSRVTCRPPPVDTDEDYLVVLPEKPGSIPYAEGILVDAGYELEGDNANYRGADNSFMSWRKGSVNLIVTASPIFALRHRAATHVCKKLNLPNKADRVMVFQAVLYGNKA